MLILTKEEMQRAEQFAVARGTDMFTLMKLAGEALADLVLQYAPPAGKKVLVLCGKGNNGGDGFICARILHEHGALVTMALVQGGVSSPLAGRAFLTVPEEVPVLYSPEDAADEAMESDIIVDAMFGFGFVGAPQGALVPLIRAVNESPAVVFSADLPSGAECDTAAVRGECVQADHTAAFSALKPAHVSYPAKRFCGQVHVCSAGVEEEDLLDAGGSFALLENKTVKKLLPTRDPEGNKGTFGKLLCVCGSVGMAGAAIMAVQAALRCGVGLVYAAVPRALYPVMAPVLPQAVFLPLDEEPDGCLTEESKAALQQMLGQMDACLIGCGLGMKAMDKVQTVLENAECPVVLDADGLNLAAKEPLLLRKRRCPLVVTPHPGEMARLMSRTIPEVQTDRISMAKLFARRYNAVAVLKGAATVIAVGENVLVNPTGNAGMAKGGRGDVLAGLAAAFAAQKMPTEGAAAAAVYLHGLAGDLCEAELTQYAMQPTDLIAHLPEAFKQVL
ncbi:MAG: NAD(P)H-hydrate dehydratase [Clostridia bacterium]|nr:NAD(P)H-hydrate dehydratase [Clostridia bacterium]